MLMIHLWSSMFASESSTLWLEIPPISGLADPFRFAVGGPKPHVRFADSRESPVDRGISCAKSSHARPIHSPNPVLEHMGAVSLVLECTAPVTLLASNKKEGWESGSSIVRWLCFILFDFFDLLFAMIFSFFFFEKTFSLFNPFEPLFFF